jgi:pyrroloquinoline-quinone synthase
MVRCTVCSIKFSTNDFESLTNHFIDFASKSDSKHIAWLNNNISKEKKGFTELKLHFENFFDYKPSGFRNWVIQKFIKKFYAENNIHPFVERMQNPGRSVLLGYVLEHQHFLKQWVKSCALILANSGQDDVIHYETDNIVSEYGGHDFCKTIPHVEYLIQMGESLGLTRNEIISTKPLKETVEALNYWAQIAQTNNWVEVMLAMHGLELIANKDLRKEGAKKHYFNPEIFNSNDITQETKNFLKEGYEADVHHVGEALKLVEKYAFAYNIIDDVQSTFLKSIDVFDSYLMARLLRAKDFELEG